MNSDNRSQSKLHISIITYNRCERLNDTLTALTGSRLKDSKISIYDNCSTDETYDICQEWIQQFSNISYTRNGVNLGFAGNLFKAYSDISGSYHWLLGDDDILPLDGLNEVHQIVDSNQFDTILAPKPMDEIYGFEKESDGYISDLMEKDWPYYYLRGFIPTFIIRSSLIKDEYLIRMSKLLAFGFPHLDLAYHLAKLNVSYIVPKTEFVISGKNYDQDISWQAGQYYGWLRSISLMDSKHKSLAIRHRLACRPQGGSIFSPLVKSCLYAYSYAGITRLDILSAVNQIDIPARCVTYALMVPLLMVPRSLLRMVSQKLDSRLARKGDPLRKLI